MPLSFRQAGNSFIQGPNISIYPSGNSYAISGNATSTGSTGFSAITSAGTGNRLLLSSITNNALIYKSLTGTSNLSINDDENGTLIFSLAGGGTGTIISGRNVGTNANSLSFFTGLSTTTNANDTLAFRNILEGPNIFISRSVTNDGDILISRGSPILVNQISNIGDGARFLSSITSNLAITRTLANASGFSQTIVNAPNAATDSDATAFITAASITSTTHITAISNLVFDLKAANLWNKMLAVYPFVGGNATSHSYNLKDPRDLDAAYRLSFLGGGWTHSASGATPNGTSSYANTFVTAATSLSVSNGHLSFYSRTQTLSGTNIEIGASINSSAIICALAVGRSTNQSIFWWGNQGASTIAIFSSSSSQGFFIGNQNGATAAGRNIYRNASAGTAASNYNNSSLGAIPSITIGARNDVAGVDSFSTKQCSFASIGSGLTDSEIVLFNTAVEAYQTTLGRQVIASTIRGVNTVVNIAPTNTTASLLYISNATSQLGTSANFGADVTTGSLGIGGAAVTTSRLPIAAGTGAISQIRLTAFSASTSLIDGDIWYSTSGNTLKFYKNNISTDFIFNDNNLAFSGLSNQVLVVDTGGTITPKYVNSLGEFNALTSLTVNTTETSIISSSLIGSTTLLSSTNPYNPQLGIGRKFRFNAKGILSFDITPPINLNIIIKLGSTVISSSSTISVGIGDPYSSEIEIDTTFTIRNSGLVVCSGKILFLTFPPSGIGGLGDPVIFGLYSQNATISTTTDQIFDCILQLDSEEVTNTITIYESTLEILN